MDAISLLKMVSFDRIFQFWRRKMSQGEDLVSMERVWALIFVLWLNIGGFFGAILAYTFFGFRFVVTICLTVSDAYTTFCSHKNPHIFYIFIDFHRYRTANSLVIFHIVCGSSSSWQPPSEEFCRQNALITTVQQIMTGLQTAGCEQDRFAVIMRAVCGLVMPYRIMQRN